MKEVEKLFRHLSDLSEIALNTRRSGHPNKHAEAKLRDARKGIEARRRLDEARRHHDEAVTAYSEVILLPHVDEDVLTHADERLRLAQRELEKRQNTHTLTIQPRGLLREVECLLQVPLAA